MQRTVYIIRLTLLGIFFSTGFIALGVHIYNLQVTRHDELMPKARAKYTSTSTEKGERGEIFDVSGSLLAANRAGYDVLVEPRRFGNRAPEKIAEQLSTPLPTDFETLHRRFSTPDRIEVVAARNIEKEAAREVKSLSLPGIRLVPTTKRYYPKDNLFANIIGFLGPEGSGATGVEQVMDQVLTSTSDQLLYERDRRGARLANSVNNLSKARDGSRVYLTIHEPIQSIVEEELMKMVRKHRPLAAYAIMADPATGAIMAMVQWPNFNPNQRFNISPEQWRNRIVSDGFEPGSIMKGISIAGALDYRVVSLNDKFDCEQGLWFHRGYSLRDAGYSHDILPVWDIIRKSSNIGTAKISLEMGRQRMYQTLHRFGFGRPTGIELPHEAPGIFRSLPEWDGLTLSRIGIGHGIVTTPLQVVQAYCALANDGILPQLHLIDRVEHPDGETKVSEPEPLGRALRPGTAAIMTSALKNVTTPDGTGRQAAVENFEVAGKTGTAQKVIDGRYSNDYHIATFIGYVPAEEPKFVLLIVADSPSREGYYGGVVAGPPFSRIAEKTLRHLQVAPQPYRP